MLYDIVEIHRRDQKMNLIGQIADHTLLWLVICIASFGLSVVLMGGDFLLYSKAVLSLDFSGAGAEFGSMASKIRLLIPFGIIITITGTLFVIAIVVDILVYVKFI